MKRDFVPARAGAGRETAGLQRSKSVDPVQQFAALLLNRVGAGRVRCLRLQQVQRNQVAQDPARVAQVVKSWVQADG